MLYCSNVNRLTTRNESSVKHVFCITSTISQLLKVLCWRNARKEKHFLVQVRFVARILGPFISGHQLLDLVFYLHKTHSTKCKIKFEKLQEVRKIWVYRERPSGLSIIIIIIIHADFRLAQSTEH